MSQNETLKPKQLQAIEHLLLGNTVSDTAEVVSVGRSTLHRWLKDDTSFQAELNRRRNELRDQIEDRLHTLAGEAVTVVEKAIQGGDARAALALLKGVGILSGQWRRKQDDAMSLALIQATRSWGVGSG